MLRKAILYGGTLLLIGVAILANPGTGWAHVGGGGGGHGGGGFGGGFHRGGYGYPHAYHHRGFSGFYPYFGFYGYYPYSYDDYPYVWSGPAYGSGYYDPYLAGTPTYLNGDTYAAPPAANSQPDPIAHLTVNVPAGARLWLDGTPTTRTGPVRLFVSPPLTPGGRYSYQIRASWDESGHEVTQSQKVEVTAGSHVSVNFPMPSQTAGRPRIFRRSDAAARAGYRIGGGDRADALSSPSPSRIRPIRSNSSLRRGRHSARSTRPPSVGPEGWAGRIFT